MVQVSYPGVYVQEVPSGSRTITGVSTAIAAFVGMTRRGPLLEPTTVLGFTDYTRIFSSDISKGEMTDQVRQFFLNGGQQAIIVRIGLNTAAARVDLLSGAGPTIRLHARSAGADGNFIRARVDYNTGSPERTFNVTVYEELVDSSGNVTTGVSETFSSLTLDENDARFIKRVIEGSSLLIDEVEFMGAVPPPTGAFTASGVLGTTAADFGAIVSAAIADTGSGFGRFRLRIGTNPVMPITIPGDSPEVDETEFASAVHDSLVPLGISASNSGTPDLQVNYVTASGRTFLRIQPRSGGPIANDDVRIELAQEDDIAVALGLGEAQGGIEVSGFAALRPTPSGIVSRLGDNSLGELLAIGQIDKADFTGAGVTSTPGDFVLPAVPFPTGGDTLDAVDAGNTEFSLIKVRENLQAVAAAIEAATDDWTAQVHGYRLALLPRFGNSAVGPAVVFSTPFDDIIFETAPTPTSRQKAAEKASGGDDGDNPTPPEYAEAYEVIDSKVDLFNILVLPKNGEDLRTALWGPASAFCVQRRAFLILDAESDVDTIDEAVAAVKALRIGIAKDHAGLYWPRLRVNPDGAPRFIDPSGTVAGVMSRIDSNRGVWKAPAGLEADLRGVLAVTVPMSDAENGRLNPLALNAIRVFPNGIVSWGARTMDGFDNSGNDDYKYVPVRRFALFIEESLYRGLKFAVFEPNDEPLWAQIRLAVGAFMNNLFRRGAFAGKTTRDAYFVKVDSETTTQNDINLGIVNVVVGFAPLKPAEFIVITIQQKAGQVQV